MNKMKIRTLLVDSDFLLKRSFSVGEDQYTKSFGSISGLYGFMITIRKLIKDHGINKLVLVWDGENGGIARHRISPEYKANRKNKSWYTKIELNENEIKKEQEKRESILKSRKRIQAYCEELFIRQIEVDEIETDDIIATYCLKYNNKEELFLFTNDRDFAQLLDLNMTIIFSNINVPITKTNYLMYFNHHYSNALVMKVIGGDPADNIKGIKGIKEDILLKYFPEMKFKHLSVKEICGKADEINKERIKNKQKPLKIFENLLKNIEKLKINYRITNLRELFLNENAYNELEQLEMPLSPENRGSKNLYKMLIEDEFLTVYKSTFVNFVEPFYTIIMSEKQLLNEYNKKSKNTL